MGIYDAEPPCALFVPPLDELSDVIKQGLEKVFAEVDVSVHECPDLTKEPFGLVMPGICGNPKIADVGGPGNLHPIAKLDRYYNLKNVSEICGHPDAFVVGAGAGPYKLVGKNCEGIFNSKFGQDQKLNNYVALLDNEEGTKYKLVKDTEAGDFALMANVLLSDGKPGPVLKIEAKRRLTDDTNFTNGIRNAIAAKYGAKPVSLGGVFAILKGSAKVHVMSDFVEGELPMDIAAKNGWLKFFDMNAPLICASVFHSADPGLDLRMEHTHCFSQHGDGGHYHYDVTPDDVHYVGYFVPAQQLYRIDRCRI